jgi:phage/plasmid-like protein (TIGR03299 family)
MGVETLEHYNNQILVGFAGQRGKAWHYSQSHQGAEPNHYDGAIPVGDVKRRLFNWEPESRPVYAKVPCGYDEATGIDENGLPYKFIELQDRQVILRSDTHADLGLFKAGYKIHEYNEWLVHNVSAILQDGLHIGSAGLLRGGAVAWVQVEQADNVTTKEGVTFRPHILAVTSTDGSIATQYKRAVTVTVCDNTLSAALSEKVPGIKIKHTRNSLTRVDEVRDALEIVALTAGAFEEQVADLCSTTVTERQWAQFLQELAPVTPEGSKVGNTRARNKQAELQHLWTADERVTPWRGTAFGVLQAVNTHAHHVATVKTSGSAQLKGNALRVERNRLRAATGEVDKLDNSTLLSLGKVLANA